MYGLRKISKDGQNPYNFFIWPLIVGAEVEAPDWNPEPVCGGGLHCLVKGRGDWSLLCGDYWAVLEFDEKDIVYLHRGFCKVKKCKIVFLSENPSVEMLKYLDLDKINFAVAELFCSDPKSFDQHKIEEQLKEYQAIQYVQQLFSNSGG